jgi:hypothetical protein
MANPSNDQRSDVWTAISAYIDEVIVDYRTALHDSLDGLSEAEARTPLSARRSDAATILKMNRALPVTSGSVSRGPRETGRQLGGAFDRRGSRERPLELFIIVVLIAVSWWVVVTAFVVTLGLWCAIADARARRRSTRTLEPSPGRPRSVSTTSVDADSEDVESTRGRLVVGSWPARPAVTGTCRTAGSRLVPFEATEPSLS